MVIENFLMNICISRYNTSIYTILFVIVDVYTRMQCLLDTIKTPMVHGLSTINFEQLIADCKLGIFCAK